MKYKSGGDFRRALEQRLRDNSLRTGIPLIRLRKTVAFDRFLARLFQVSPEQWVVKGGLAIQLRLGNKARTTKDIDLLALPGVEEIHTTLQAAGRLALEDYFSFTVSRPTGSDNLTRGMRYTVRALLDGRVFEEFHLDVGVADPMLDPPDYKTMPSLLDFADIPPARVPCFPVTQQIAEKFHAYTRPRSFGDNSRVKDFVDILLLMRSETIDEKQLGRAFLATFSHAGTHPLPAEVPPPPVGWARPFRKMSRETGLGDMSLEQAYLTLKDFLNPVLELVAGRGVQPTPPHQK